MTDTGLTNWGLRYGLTLEQVKRLGYFAELYAQQQTHAHNGDRHPKNMDWRNKNRNVKLWEADAELTAIMLKTLIRGKFDGINFNGSLYPTLIKGGDNSILIPSQDDQIE